MDTSAAARRRRVLGADAPRIARLRRADIQRCVELEQELFPGDDPWSRAAFASELDHGHFFVGAYDASGALLGYAGIALVAPPPEAEAEVHTIAVAPRSQGVGVGTALLRALLAHADKHRAATFLEVRTDNEPAIRLYRGHGFEMVGLRKGYYQPSGADAYTMRRAAVPARPADSTVEGNR
jgi:[ribosomal protein S18]-alanine N-acetyltransferase